MRILVIGGTVFVGRHFVEAAIARGHDVTIFHRGHTPIPEHWPVDELLGDRDGGLGVLDGHFWDAAVDCCGYVPRLVADSCQALKLSVSRYLFISTCSVYSTPSLEVVKSEAPLGTEVVDGKTYGPLKVECETVAAEVFGDRLTVVRPGLLAGPFDPTFRFDYWVDRFTRYKRVLVPQARDYPLELLDARDLADFTLKLLEENVAGTFDAVGTNSTFGEVIDAIRSVGRGQPVYASVAWLQERGIEPWATLPLVGIDDPTFRALMQIYPRDALRYGLRRRPLQETARDTAAWTLGLQEPRVKAGSGLSREREEALLDELAATV
jgi:2'-hydroxyisoflavone reductase